MSREVMQQALDALISQKPGAANITRTDRWKRECVPAIEALRAELANPETFQPDWVDFRNGFNSGVEEAFSEVAQLCKDYCSMNGNVYIRDVLNTLEPMKERLLKPDRKGEM
jgi:hypothetical protein